MRIAARPAPTVILIRHPSRLPRGCIVFKLGTLFHHPTECIAAWHP